MSLLLPRFMRFVQARGLVSEQDVVLVALSGGVDSMVLLHLLRTCADAFDIRLRAAHFDHAMRADSGEVADWVAGICDAWQVPLVSRRSAAALRSEADARAARYAFLQAALRESGSNRIATAHHADDQVETVLLRLLRGTGMRGLAGIPLRRGRLIRPLLPFTKAELIDYARENGVPFRTDPTNAEPRFARNRLRTSVLPELSAARPETAAAIVDLARHAARTEQSWRLLLAQVEEDVILSRNTQGYELARAVLLEYDAELRARVLRRVMRRFGVVPGRAQTRHILEFVENAESGTALELPRQLRIERNFDRIALHRIAGDVVTDTELAIGGVHGSGGIDIGGRHYDVEWKIDETRGGMESFDVSILESAPRLRGWRAGDRIRLAYGTKKLKKLFAEHRIAVAERARIPVLSDVDGRVYWVVGVARSMDALPHDTGAVLNLTVKNAQLG